MTPEDIELLFQSRQQPHSSVASAQDENQDLISEQETDFRVQKLRNVLSLAQHAWLTGPEDFELIAEKIADGSRDGRSPCPFTEYSVLN